MLWFIPASTTKWSDQCTPLSPPHLLWGGCWWLSLPHHKATGNKNPSTGTNSSWGRSLYFFTTFVEMFCLWVPARRASAKILSVPYLHSNKAFNHVDLRAVLTCLNLPLSNQLILKLPITPGAEEQSRSQDFVVQKAEWPTYIDRKNWDKTEGILSHVRNIDAHEIQALSPPHTYLFISIVTELFWGLHQLITTVAIPLKNLVPNQRNGAEDKGVAALQQWEDLFPAYAHLLRHNGERSPKLSIHIHYQGKEGGKEFSLYFFWFQEWLASLASLKWLVKCSVSLLTIKGIIYFIVAFSLKRDWYHKEPGRGGQGGILRALGCFKSCFIFCLKALHHIL